MQYRSNSVKSYVEEEKKIVEIKLNQITNTETEQINYINFQILIIIEQIKVYEILTLEQKWKDLKYIKFEIYNINVYQSIKIKLKHISYINEKYKKTV